MIEYSVEYKKVRISKANGWYAVVRSQYCDFCFTHPPCKFPSLVAPTLLGVWND